MHAWHSMIENQKIACSLLPETQRVGQTCQSAFLSYLPDKKTLQKLPFPTSSVLFSFFPQEENVEEKRPPDEVTCSAGWEEGPQPRGRDFSSQICSSKPE